MTQEALDSLAALVRGRRTLVLTGAGCSTESGIPDYRGPESIKRVRTPIQHRAFIESAEVRRRYWARSVMGWPRFRTARPNPAHVALAVLEAEGVVQGLITQNVDRLHRAAGSKRVIELHGALADVRCLDCDALSSRDALQERLLALNPRFLELDAEARPDGDAELPEEAVDRFQVAPCEACGGTLKPDVVFFGGHVPAPRVEQAFAWVDAAEALIVVGSSLTVFSGYRFVKRSAERGHLIALVNRGETRADEHAHLRVDAAAGEILPALASLLGCELGAAAARSRS